MAIGRIGIKAGLDISQCRGEACEIGLLRQITDRGPGLDETVACIGLHQTGRNSQQRGFSRTVAPDEADAITRGNGQSRARQQRRGTEGETDILQKKLWRGHRPLNTTEGGYRDFRPVSPLAIVAGER